MNLSSQLVRIALLAGTTLQLASACGGDDSTSAGSGGSSAGASGAAAKGGGGGTTSSGGKTSTTGGKTSGTGGTMGEAGMGMAGTGATTGGTLPMGGEPGIGGAGGEPAVGGAGGEGGQLPPSMYHVSSAFPSAAGACKSASFQMIATLGEGLGSAAALGKSAQMRSAKYTLASGVTVSVK